MALVYVGDGRYIGGVPAEDLPDETIKRIAGEWGLSVAQTEGLLIERGLYKSVSKDAPKAPKKDEE